MSRRLLGGTFLVLVLSCGLLFAGHADLQIVGASHADNHITIVVHNPSTSADEACIQVSVLLSDNSSEVLTGCNTMVAAGATTVITLTASSSIAEIIDDPQPIDLVP